MKDELETTMVCIGAVFVLAEQFSPDDPARFVVNRDPFQLRLYASRKVLGQLGQDAIRDIGFEFVGSSEWAARIIAMKNGEKALLPSQQGCYCFVRRYAAEAALGISEFMPTYTQNWSEGR